MAKRLLDKRWPWLAAAALIVAVYLSTWIEIRLPGRDHRPAGTAQDIERLAERDVNLLFILIDTMRADHLGSYGYERDTSPTLDRLAAGGVRFARQLAQSSWTKASMASLWTGLYPSRTGVTRFEHVIPDEATLPAEILREAGFRTAAIFRNGWVEGYFGFDQGFDLYTRPASRPPPASVRRENPTLKTVGTDADIVESAIEFLRTFGNERWLLYLHLMDLHEYLYDEDSALFGTGYVDVYDNAIRRENLVLDQLLGYMARKGYLENTLVVIASDHGEAFRERGLEGHARAVYRESTLVPLILSFPFRLEPGAVVEPTTRNVDIWPTVLDLLGLRPLEGIDGRSRVREILAAARGEPAPQTEDGEVGYAHLDQTWGRREKESQPTVAVVDDRFRYVRTETAYGTHREELFDSRRDAAERENVLKQEPEAASRMRGLAESFLENEPLWEGETPTLELDEVHLNQLRALGYKVP